MDFYTRVAGLAPVRFDEFRCGEAPFPSVRLAPTFGARGWGPEGMYFPDPDGNVVEVGYND
jgi:hypothetical protein